MGMELTEMLQGPNLQHNCNDSEQVSSKQSLHMGDTSKLLQYKFPPNLGTTVNKANPYLANCVFDAVGDGCWKSQDASKSCVQAADSSCFCKEPRCVMVVHLASSSR